MRFGKPCAGKPHARFDEGREQTVIGRRAIPAYSIPLKAMPGSQFLYMQSVLVLMGVFIGLVVGIAHLARRSATRAATITAIICAVTIPFLFYFRAAVYDGVPAYRDTSLGWPLIYAHAQDDASLIWVSSRNLALDLSVGIVTAVVVLAWHRRTKHANVG